ncbi:MAG TPA: four helix bundle protein, partial [Membranihabitans sp.]|nr:four helix bundle protein [Membranihabitans sp.]
QSIKEYIQFLYISLGSASELETQILLCNRLGFMTNDQANKLIPKIENIIKVIGGLIRYRKKLTPR